MISCIFFFFTSISVLIFPDYPAWTAVLFYYYLTTSSVCFFLYFCWAVRPWNVRSILQVIKEQLTLEKWEVLTFPSLGLISQMSFEQCAASVDIVQRHFSASATVGDISNDIIAIRLLRSTVNLFKFRYESRGRSIWNNPISVDLLL